MITPETIKRAADWHGQQAMDYYRSASGTKNRHDRNLLEAAFRYHGRMADYLWGYVSEVTMPTTIVALAKKWGRR